MTTGRLLASALLAKDQLSDSGRVSKITRIDAGPPRSSDIHQSGRRVVPISFDGSLDPHRSSSSVLEHIDPAVLRLEESAFALETGPSQHVVTKLVTTLRYTRQEKKRQRVYMSVVLVFAIMVIAVFLTARCGEQTGGSKAC